MKGTPWEALDKLHEGALILNPKSSSAKSAVLTEEGRRASEGALRRQFTRHRTLAS